MIHNRHTRRIFLYGPPGSGKTTAGELLARQLNLPFDDLDVLIERQAGCTIGQLFAQEGEAGFRKREADQLRAWIKNEAGVLALGGGALLDPANREHALRSGVVICLSASLPALVARMEGQALSRPLLAGEDMATRLEKLFLARAEHYTSFPLNIQTTGRTPDEVVQEIQRTIGWFRLPNHEEGYDVRILEGALGILPEVLNGMGFGGSIGLVSDENVMPLYGKGLAAGLELAGYKTSSFTIPAGERDKTIQTVSKLWESFLSSGLDRSSLILALGGGVVCDVAGFAAATFMRGVRWIAVPTSLLAMVDASLGGKTGVDLPFGKNLVGSFYPPAQVIADLAVLETLPVDEWRCGLAETIKHGLLADPDLLRDCQKMATFNPDFYAMNPEERAMLIKRSVAVKAQFVRRDPYEKGERAALNLGHTIGHAIELVSGYTIRHGEAVAIGLVLEARLAERLGLAEGSLADEIAALLKNLGLPAKLPCQMDQGAVLTAMEGDKKRQDGSVRFALPARIGGYVFSSPSMEIVRDVLEGVQ
ncbi:MAG: 3-dehydroquinate synthase [Anaerolineae bacterium]|nr:3-dehydroquinate synthase [Anaerolineae bacterium]